MVDRVPPERYRTGRAPVNFNWREELERLHQERVARLHAEVDAYALLAAIEGERRDHMGARASALAFCMGTIYPLLLRRTAAYPESDREAIIRLAARLLGIPRRVVRRDLEQAMAARP